MPDPAKDIKTALANHWSTAHPTWTATLQVDDDYRPTPGSPTVLIADDGNQAVNPGAWMVRKTLRRTSIRLTAFAKGRDEAHTTLTAAVDRIIAHRPASIARIEDAPDPLVTRDRATGAFLAWVSMPVLVRPA